MSAYEEAHELEKELVRAFSVRDNASVDNISRKLFQTLRNSQYTNFSSRLNTLKEFDSADELRSAAAGLVFQSPIPVGGRGILSGTAIYGGTMYGALNPATATALVASSSPRLMGEASNLAGRIAGTVNQMSPPPQVTGLLDAIPENIRQGVSDTTGILKRPLTDLTLLEARAIEEENN